MTTDQLIRNILERAISDGLVLPATNRFADPDPQRRTYEELKELAQMVVRWQKGRMVAFNADQSDIRYD
ncbi:MAG: hypothetical protein JWP89_3628 [Schlesneria sp.]|nr:hypothetical protein [Schlesneria sp.]